MMTTAGNASEVGETDQKPVPVIFTLKTWFAVGAAYTSLVLMVGVGWWSLQEATRDNAVRIAQHEIVNDRQDRDQKETAQALQELAKIVERIQGRMEGKTP